MMKLGERIKKLRNDAGLTQEELGELLGIQKASVQKYEKGVVVNLKPYMIERIAIVFNTTPSYIMGWDRFDEDALSNEVHLIEAISDKFGIVGAELYNIGTQLNEEGLRKILFYAEDIKASGKYERNVDR